MRSGGGGRPGSRFLGRRTPKYAIVLPSGDTVGAMSADRGRPSRLTRLVARLPRNRSSENGAIANRVKKTRLRSVGEKVISSSPRRGGFTKTVRAPEPSGFATTSFGKPDGVSRCQPISPLLPGGVAPAVEAAASEARTARAS